MNCFLRRAITVFLLVLALTACSPGTDKSGRGDPELEYYRGVYHSCIYAAVERNEPLASAVCDPFLKKAIDEDWYGGTWPRMPYLP